MLGYMGIVIIVIGTMLTLWESLKPYRGHKYNHERDPMIYGIDPVVDGALPVKTKEYKTWKNRRRMLIVGGFILIVVGSVLQLVTNMI